MRMHWRRAVAVVAGFVDCCVSTAWISICCCPRSSRHCELGEERDKGIRGQGGKKIAGLLTGGWGRLDLNVFAHDALLDLLALAGQHDGGGGCWRS